jgi:hypothetical protein
MGLFAAEINLELNSLIRSFYDFWGNRWKEDATSFIENIKDEELEELDLVLFKKLLYYFKLDDAQKLEELFEEVISKNEKFKYLYMKAIL